MGNIDALEKEIAQLKSQVMDINSTIDRVSEQISNIKTEYQQQSGQQAMEQNTYQKPVYSQPVYQQPVYRQPSYQQPEYQQSAYQQPVYQQPTYQQSTYQYERKVEENPNNSEFYSRTDRLINESWIGTHFMGIAASVLVFISMILFAKLLLPYFNDVVKVVLMFAASGLITAVGYIFHKKNPQNSFFTALYACGEGCLFLSVVVTRAIFMFINDIAMYIILFLWGVIFVLIDKKKSLLFQVIADLGFMVAVFFSLGNNKTDLVIPMLGYILVSAGIYQYVYREKKLQRNIQSAVNLFAMLLYSYSMAFYDERSVSVAACGIIIGVICFIAYIVRLRYSYSDKCYEHNFFAIADSVVAVCAVGAALNRFDLQIVLVMIMMFVTAIAGEIYLIRTVGKSLNSDLDVFTGIWAGAWFWALFAVADYKYGNIFDTGLLFLILLPFMGCGLYKKNSVIKGQIWILVGILTAMGLNSDAGIMFSFCLLCFCAFTFIMDTFVISDGGVFKKIGYWATIISTMLLSFSLRDILDDEKVMLVMVTVTGLFNCLMVRLRIYINHDGTEDEPFAKTLDIVNLLALFTALFSMFNTKTSVINWAFIVLAVVFASLDVKNNIASGNKKLLYSGIKYGIVLLCALMSNNCRNYIVSISILVFAIVCIVIGFKLKYKGKELRVYGLVMSMICVAKFIMVDIAYENTLGHAISFLISGILCFGISALYNFFAKKDDVNNSQNVGV